MKKLSLGILLTVCLSPSYAAFQFKEKDSLCTASTYLSHVVIGGKCYYSDEVMVGIEGTDPFRVRCARIQVTCNRDSGQREAREAEEKPIETDSDSR